MPRRSPDEAIVTAIVSTLLSSTGVTGLVATRIYNNVPQNTGYPYVVVALPSGRRQDTLGRFGASSMVDIKAVSQAFGDQEGIRILDQCVRALDFQRPTLNEHTMLGLAYDGTERYQEVANGIVTRHHVASCRAWTEQSST